MTREFPVPRASRFDPIGSSWRLLAAPQTLMALMGCLAVLLVVGTLIPQISPRVDGDPQTWLVAQTGFWDQQNGLVRVLGLGDIYHAAWFYLLLALLGLCLFVRFIESLDLAWQATTGRNWSLSSFVFWGRHGPRVRLSSSRAAESVQALMRGFFAQRGYRWTDVPGLESSNAVVARREALLWAQPLLDAGLLLALLGLSIMGAWGWQVQDWQPAPGERRGLGRGTPYAVRLDAFELPQASSGGELGFYSTISWLDGEDVVRQDVLSVGHPATFEGMTVHQVGYVPAVKISVRDEEGLLGLQLAGAEPSVPGEVEVTFVNADAQPLILIPSQDRFLALAVDAECAGGRPSLQVAILGASGEDLVLLGTLSDSGSLSGAGLQIAVDLTYRPTLRVDHRPAMGLVLAGMALAVVAFIAGWAAPARLMWIATQADDGGETHVQVLAPAGGWGRRWLRHMAERLEEELAGDE